MCQKNDDFRRLSRLGKEYVGSISPLSQALVDKDKIFASCKTPWLAKI